MRVAGLALGVLIVLSPGSGWADDPGHGRGCETVAAELGAARAAGRVADATALLAEAGQGSTGCTPQRLFCLGRSVALAHVEAAYAAANAGHPDEAERLFEAGRTFGAPWPLLVGLGDASEGKARASHDPAAWTKASLRYQEALSAAEAPALCPEEPSASREVLAPVLNRLVVASLLARPLSVFRDKCAPCPLPHAMLEVTDGARPRVLPITFADGQTGLTPEGRVAAKALAACARTLGWPKLDLTVHADARGSQGFNLALSRRRAGVVRRALRDAGYEGVLEARAVGKSQPLAINDPVGLLPREVQRANRRVEWREPGPVPAPSCAASSGPPT